MFQHCRPLHDVVVISSVSWISQEVCESFQLWQHVEDRSNTRQLSCGAVWFDSSESPFKKCMVNFKCSWVLHKVFSIFLLEWWSMCWFNKKFLGVITMAMLTEEICQRNSNHSPYISKLYIWKIYIFTSTFGQFVLTVPLQVKDQLRPNEKNNRQSSQLYHLFWEVAYCDFGFLR